MNRALRLYSSSGIIVLIVRYTLFEISRLPPFPVRYRYSRANNSSLMIHKSASEFELKSNARPETLGAGERERERDRHLHGRRVPLCKIARIMLHRVFVEELRVNLLCRRRAVNVRHNKPHHEKYFYVKRDRATLRKKKKTKQFETTTQFTALSRISFRFFVSSPPRTLCFSTI